MAVAEEEDVFLARLDGEAWVGVKGGEGAGGVGDEAGELPILFDGDTGVFDNVGGDGGGLG